MLTREEVERALPASLKTSATQQFTDQINNMVSDPETAAHIRDNFIGYVSVLRDGKYKTDDYLHAVAYVSFKLMGLTNLEAYQRTFPGRYQTHVANGLTGKEIASFVAAYHRGKLVNQILEQSLVPTWVLNQDVYQQAINIQAELMRTANSEKVRCDAANSLLTHLKRPETKDINLNLGVQESSGLTELKDALKQLASKQIDAIETGTPTRLIAAQPIMDAEYSEVGSDQTGTG